MDSDTVAIAIVYFVLGLMQLPQLAMTFFLKDELQASPAMSVMVSSYVQMPWIIKPLYGLVSDTFPVVGYRRKSYLVLFGVLGSLSWVYIVFCVNTYWGAVFGVMWASFCAAVCDVVIDSVVVEKSHGKPQEYAGSLQSLTEASSALGGIAASLTGGFAMKTIGSQSTFLVTALLPLITCAAGFILKEEKHNDSAGAKATVYSKLQSHLVLSWHAMIAPRVLCPTMFVAIVTMLPNASVPMFYFATEKLEFTPFFLGASSTVGHVCAIIGVILYSVFFKHMNMRSMSIMISSCQLVLAFNSLALLYGLHRAWGISDSMFALSVTAVESVCGQLFTLPLLTLAARLCPKGIEATFFSLLAGVSTVASVVGAVASSSLTNVMGVHSENFDALVRMVLLCAVLNVVRLPCNWLLPATVVDTVPGVPENMGVNEGEKEGEMNGDAKKQQ